MEKNYVDDIYTLTGVTATSQVREFYKEVVANNIEKYVAITTQNIKFKFDAINDCAVMLHADEQYGINPSYRKIEVEPLDELIEQANAQEEVVEEPAVVVVREDEVVEPAVVEEDVDVENFETEKPIEEGILEIEEPTEKEIAEEVIHEDEQIEDTVQENTEEDVEIEEHTDDEIAADIDNAAEIENLKAYIAQLEEDIKLKDERAAVAEAELERISNRNVELEIQNTELQRQVEDALNNFNDTGALSIDKLFEDAKALGYKIFISKE